MTSSNRTLYCFVWSVVVCCSHQFYKGKLKDGVTAEQKPAAAGINWPQPQQPVMVLAVQGREEQAKKSKGKVIQNQVRASGCRCCCLDAAAAAACACFHSWRYIRDVGCSCTSCTPTWLNGISIYYHKAPTCQSPISVVWL